MKAAVRELALATAESAGDFDRTMEHRRASAADPEPITIMQAKFLKLAADLAAAAKAREGRPLFESRCLSRRLVA